MNELFLILAALLVVILIITTRCEETEHFQKARRKDCILSGWSNWSECGGICKDQGWQTRTRSIVQSASGGGTACPPTNSPELTQRQQCQNDAQCRQRMSKPVATAAPAPTVSGTTLKPQFFSDNDLTTDGKRNCDWRVQNGYCFAPWERFESCRKTCLTAGKEPKNEPNNFGINVYADMLNTQNAMITSGRR